MYSLYWLLIACEYVNESIWFYTYCLAARAFLTLICIFLFSLILLSFHLPFLCMHSWDFAPTKLASMLSFLLFSAGLMFPFHRLSEHLFNPNCYSHHSHQLTLPCFHAFPVTSSTVPTPLHLLHILSIITSASSLPYTSYPPTMTIPPSLLKLLILIHYVVSKPLILCYSSYSIPSISFPALQHSYLIPSHLILQLPAAPSHTPLASSILFHLMRVLYISAFSSRLPSFLPSPSTVSYPRRVANEPARGWQTPPKGHRSAPLAEPRMMLSCLRLRQTRDLRLAWSPRKERKEGGGREAV